MVDIKRDMFPPHILTRITTPVQRKKAVSNLCISRTRPWGGILYPQAQTPGIK